MLSRSDIVLVKHFYQERRSSEEQSKYPEIRPGIFSIRPVWVYEPGKQSAGLKGAVLMVRESYFFDDGNMRGGEKAEATLDLDELTDMRNALSQVQSSSAPWRASAANDEIELQFSAKDDFSMSAFHGESQGDILDMQIGPRSVAINLVHLPEIIQNVDAVIQLLNSKS